jgi:hypothetical protein
MKKNVLLATLASLLIAIGVPSVLSAANPAITAANGNDVVLPDGSVYQQNDDGSYSWIPNVATANAMGLDWDNLQSVDVLPGPVGDRFPAVASLANASASRLTTGIAPAQAAPVAARSNGNDFLLPDGSVYELTDDGSYSWIPDVATATAMGVNFNDLVQVDELDGPTGMPFPHL